MRLKLIILFFFICSNQAFAASPIDFSQNCGEGDNYTLSFVGDLIMHSPLQRKAARLKDFKVLWEDVIPYFEMADFSYANLETALADGIDSNNKEVKDPGHVYDKDVYTTYPKFNTHFSLAGDLLDSGIDIVSTANNHSLDRGYKGVNKTIDNLEKAGLPFTGTKKSKGDEGREWFTITENKGLSVAWISCTEKTNGIKDRKNQVLHCYKNKQIISKLIKNLRSEVDVIAMLPHWGKEKAQKPSKDQKSYGHKWLEEGADLVIGSHPHVLQPMEKYTTKDGRDTLIFYSLGNFTTFHYDVEQKTTMVLFVNMEKGRDGVTRINGVKYVPLYMRNRTGRYMDVEVHPLFPSDNFSGKGYEDVSESSKQIFKMFDKSNAILEDASDDIELSHCDRGMI